MVDAISSVPIPLLPSQFTPEASGSGFSPDTTDLGAEFESVFMSMMIKQLRSAMGTSLFQGDKADALGGLFDLHIGKQLADSGGIGIQRMVDDWLATQLKASEAGTQLTAETTS